MSRLAQVVVLLTLVGASPTRAMTSEQRSAFIQIFHAQVVRCFTLPLDTRSAKVRLDVRLERDGSLSQPPKVIGQPNSAVAQAAIRAIQRCSPYRIRADFNSYYDEWKQLRLEIDASEN